MSFGTSGTYYPWGPFGSTFWGGFWSPPPGVNLGVTDITTMSTMSALALDYQSVSLQWQQPAEVFDLYVIVRSTYGPPMTLTDGLTVKFGSRTDNQTSFVDDNLEPGFYYYSMFVRMAQATPQWSRVAQAFALVPDNNAAGEWMFELLPDWYQTEDEKTPGHPSNHAMAAWGQLRRFLEIIGLQYDTMRSEAKSLLNIYDPRITRADMLEYFAATFGFPFEPHIGYGQLHALMAKWIDILKTKGTRPGIELFVKAFTGYWATVTRGNNLMLTADDGAGTQGIGFWRGVTNGVGVITAVTPAAPYLANVTTALRFTCNNAAGIGAIDEDYTDNKHVMATAIPITGGLPYQLQFGARAVEAFTVNVTADIFWYTSAGAFISAPALVTNSVGNGAWVTLQGTATAPANAAYAAVAFHTAAMASGNHLDITGINFNQHAAGSFLPYESARDVHIVMNPTRVNYIRNPNMQGTTDMNWFVVHAPVTPSRSSNQANPLSGGTWSMRLDVAAGGGNAAWEFPSGFAYALPLNKAGDVWSWMFTIYPGQTPIGEIAYAYGIPIYNNPSSSYTVRGARSIPNIGLGWTQVHVDVPIEDRGPTNPCVGMYVGIGMTGGPTVGATYYVDTMVLEKNAYVYQYSYFDGSSDLSSADFAWSGAVYESASMYFPNRYVRESRLRSILPEYLPPFCSFELSYALPT